MGNLRRVGFMCTPKLCFCVFNSIIIPACLEGRLALSFFYSWTNNTDSSDGGKFTAYFFDV